MGKGGNIYEMLGASKYYSSKQLCEMSYHPIFQMRKESLREVTDLPRSTQLLKAQLIHKTGLI